VALTVIAASQLMVILDATIVNIALPQIQQSLGFSTTDLSWVLNAYTLTFGGLLLLGGRAGDILGHRRVFIAGILLFTLASFLGGLATTSGWLLAARALQGVGGAIAAPTALALITTNFAEGPERNRAFGVFGAVAGAGGALGLLAGGMLTSSRSPPPSSSPPRSRPGPCQGSAPGA
jgi:MFS family permease